VYAAIAERGGQVIQSGHAAIVDAVYARADDRLAIERVAAAAGVPFTGLWLDAPEPVLIARAAQRRLDVSDADAGVIRQQVRQDLGAMSWTRIDASGGFDDVVTRASAVLRERAELDAVSAGASPG
jgi:predicted kinase